MSLYWIEDHEEIVLFFISLILDSKVSKRSSRENTFNVFGANSHPYFIRRQKVGIQVNQLARPPGATRSENI